MAFGFFGRLAAPLALSVGLASCSGNSASTPQAAPEASYPIVFSQGQAKEIKPVFQGALGDAARFMKEKSLETFKEDAYLYLPKRHLLFDVGIIETAMSVHRQGHVEEAILQFYKSAGLDFHTHLDYHTKPVFDGVMSVFDRELRDLRSRVKHCSSPQLLTLGYFDTCLPSRIDWERKQLEELNALKRYYERLGRVPADEKVWLSYVPSDRDLLNHFHSPFRIPGQKSGIVIADYSPKPAIVWYDLHKLDSIPWYTLTISAFKLDRNLLTKPKLDEIYAQSELHGISLRFESIPVFR